MHERSLMRCVFKQVEQLMVEDEYQRVAAVRLSIGEFSGVEPALMEIAFNEMVDDSPLRGAVLQLVTVPLEAKCEACGRQFAVERFVFECPECSSGQVKVLRGEDLMLESLVVEASDYEKARTNGNPA